MKQTRHSVASHVDGVSEAARRAKCIVRLMAGAASMSRLSSMQHTAPSTSRPPITVLLPHHFCFYLFPITPRRSWLRCATTWSSSLTRPIYWHHRRQFPSSSSFPFSIWTFCPYVLLIFHLSLIVDSLRFAFLSWYRFYLLSIYIRYSTVTFTNIFFIF